MEMPHAFTSLVLPSQMGIPHGTQGRPARRHLNALSWPLMVPLIVPH
jgi:hypothetical protein